MKKIRIVTLLLLFSIILTACVTRKSNGPQFEYINSDAVYKVAWQYVVAQIDKVNAQINDARITRLELVDTYKGSDNLAISIYALEFAYSIEEESGYCPGGTSAGSPYLFIANDGEVPRLLGIKFTKDILAEGGFSKAGQTVVEENKTLDFSKHSTASTIFQTTEIDAATKVAEKYYLEETGETIIPINIWFDENRYHTDIMECLQNPLYGIDIAAKNNNLIILYGDLCVIDSEFEGLSRNWKTIMTRESIDAPWKIVDAGY